MDEDVEEYEAIRNMINRANEEGLIVEVVHYFGMFRESGDSVEEAAAAALYEWDC